MPGPDGRVWRDLLANGDRVMTIRHTPASESTAVGLGGTVVAYGIRRNLYIYWNTKLAQIIPLEPNTATAVLVYPLRVQPGENTLGFYAPEARTMLADGRQVNFRFADDWGYGPVAYRGEVLVPRGGAWNATLMAGPTVTTPTPPTVRIGNSLCAWRATPSGWTSTLSLMAGRTDVAMEELQGEGYTMWLTPEGGATPPVRSLHPVGGAPAGVTTYQLGPVAGPTFLVVSQGFHPAWQAQQSGQRLEHFPMQGFANGFWVPAGAAAPVTVRFQLQRWFQWGVACSVITALALLALICSRGR